MKDVVYTVKPDDSNEELRYSLRSLSNIGDFSGRVFIAGYKPSWLKNVIHVPNFQTMRKSKYKNAKSNWQKVNAHPELSQEYIYMNDDFFVMKPIKEVPVLHNGDQDEFIERYLKIGSKAYVQGAITTKHVVHRMGVGGKLKNYELHVPMVFDKTKRKALSLLMREANPEGKNTHFRTAYGNYYKLGGRKMKDVKIHGNGFAFDKNSTFLSTSDESFAQSDVGTFIRKQFPKKSRYEK